MSRDQAARMAGLADVAGVILEARLADLRAANALREATQARIAALERRTAPPTDPEMSPVSLARNDLLYDRWVESRRVELNLRLARETAAWHEERARAATALGRTDALRRLEDQLRADIARKTARHRER